MKRFSFLLLLLSLLFSPSESYDHLQLVLTWIPTFCQMHGCRENLRPNFTLHGLWPAYSNGSTVPGTSCSNDNAHKLNSTDVHNIRLELGSVWRNINPHISDETFWRHEWNDHGVCVLSEMKKIDYFNIIRTRMRNMNMLNTLHTGGIDPSTHVAHNKVEIAKALKNIIGTNARIYVSCAHLNDTHSKLLEILLCMDKKGVGYESCARDENSRGCLTGNPKAKPKGKVIILPPSI